VPRYGLPATDGGVPTVTRQDVREPGSGEPLLGRGVLLREDHRGAVCLDNAAVGDEADPHVLRSVDGVGVVAGALP